MRKIRSFLYLSPSTLLSVVRTGLLAILLVACAPATATVTPVQPVTVVPSETLPPSLPTLDTSVQATAAPALATPLPIATSRGPNLEAIDPTTVSLASGGIQFVEFFRFT